MILGGFWEFLVERRRLRVYQLWQPLRKIDPSEDWEHGFRLVRYNQV